MNTQISTNTNNNNHAQQGRCYETAVSWGKWIVQSSSEVYDRAKRASLSMINDSINYTTEAIFTSPTACYFLGIENPEMSKLKLIFEQDSTVKGNMLRYDALRLRPTKALENNEITLIPLGTEDISILQDTKPLLNYAIENIVLPEENRASHFDVCFDRPFSELYTAPQNLYIVCLAKHYLNHQHDYREDHNIVVALPLLMKSKTIPNEGIQSEDLGLKPLMTEVKIGLEAAQRILAYLFEYQSIFFLDKLDEQGMNILRNEATVGLKKAWDEKLRISLVDAKKEIDTYKDSKSRQARRNEMEKMKKEASQFLKNFTLDEPSLTPARIDNQEEYIMDVLRHAKRLQTLLKNICEAIDTMRMCPINIYNIYVLLNAVKMGTAILDKNPYLFRYNSKIISTIFLTINKLTSNISSIAQDTYRKMGGDPSVFEKVDNYINTQGNPVILHALYKATKMLQEENLEKNAEQKKKKSNKKKGETKKTAKQGGKSNRKSKFKIGKLEIEESPSSSSDEAETPVDLDKTSKSVKEEEKEEDFVKETKYPIARKEKKEHLSKKEAILKEVKESKQEKTEEIIEKFARAHKKNARMVVSHEEFQAIYESLSPKNKEIYNIVMNAEHHEAKNEDIKDLINDLADRLEEVLGDNIAKEVRKIEPHNAHRGSDTGKLQPANFLKILRPRLILLGLFNQKKWKPQTTMDHDAYFKFLNQNLHQTLNTLGIYAKDAVIEYLKLNEDLIAFAK